MERLKELAMLYTVLKLEDLTVPDVEQADEFKRMVENCGYNPEVFDIVKILNNNVGRTCGDIVNEMVAICDLL